MFAFESDGDVEERMFLLQVTLTKELLVTRESPLKCPDDDKTASREVKRKLSRHADGKCFIVPIIANKSLGYLYTWLASTLVSCKDIAC